MSNVNKRWTVYDNGGLVGDGAGTVPAVTIENINNLLNPLKSQLCVVKIIALITFLVTWFLLYLRLSEKW